MGISSSRRNCWVSLASPAQHHGEDGSGVEVGGGQDPELGQDRRGDLLSLVDEEHRPVASGLDVCQPPLAQRLEAGPSVVRRESHAEQLAELAVEVGDGALGPGQHPDLDVAQLVQVCGQDPSAPPTFRSRGHR